MNNSAPSILDNIYKKCGFEISDFKQEEESKECNACNYQLNGFSIIRRDAKITPKKIGQFVTFWKRIENGPIAPFSIEDKIDFFVVNVSSNSLKGQFIFPIAVLVQKGVLSSKNKEGKRAFRVYPSWDITTNNQAKRTQKWQLDYFIEFNDTTKSAEVLKLYSATLKI